MLYYHRPYRRRPIYSRALLDQSFANSGLAIEPPTPAVVHIDKAPVQAQVTPEDIGRMFAGFVALAGAIAEFLRPVILFSQRMENGYREASRSPVNRSSAPFRHQRKGSYDGQE